MIRSLVVWLGIGLCSLSWRTDIGGAQPGLSSLLTRTQYARMFPHRNSLYTYAALIKAAAAFPAFAGEGDRMVRLRELAAFFGEIGHETTNGGDGADGGPYVWGLYYTEELGCQDGHCTQYNTGNSTYQAAPGKTYYGRGPIQLSYPYNYGQAGTDLGLPLLQHPELVSHDGVIAFKTAIWFWMRSYPNQPSCHDVMTGKWQPTEEDRRLGRRPGFGMTILLINGNVECGSRSASVVGDRQDRIGYYRYFAGLLKVPVEKDCDCAGMTPYHH